MGYLKLHERKKRVVRGGPNERKAIHQAQINEKEKVQTQRDRVVER
jgi:hypothetical protein